MLPLLEAVKVLLWEQWDPIGVNAIGDARDEYDSYAFSVWQMLLRNASVEDIAAYLSDLETGHIGLSSDSGRARAVAREAVRLRGRWEEDQA